MFNGIIFNSGIVQSIKKTKNSSLVEIKSNLKISKKDIGCSISCNGVCLTLIAVKNKSLFFYLSLETLKRSNFKYLVKGDHINMEKSLKYGDTISGHFVQGHVDTTAKINKIKIIDKSWFYKIMINKKYIKFFSQKASININGVSLTISNIYSNIIEFTVIPHTLQLTNLSRLKQGSIVNIEIDILSKYLTKLNS